MSKVKIMSTIIALLVLFVIVQYQIDHRTSSGSLSLPLSGKVIVLDPGHGGVDGGAVGGDEVLEKEIKLKILLIRLDNMQKQGAHVIITKEKDKDIEAKDTRGYSRRKVED